MRASPRRRLAVRLLLVCLALSALGAPRAQDLAPEPLTLATRSGNLADRLAPGLNRRIPEGPMADWPPDLTMAPRTGHRVSLEDPLDLVAQYRVPLDYCPTFWPEHEPQRTVGEFCYRDMLTNWQLFQGDDTNPFVVAQRQVLTYNRDSDELAERLAWMAAYLYVHRGHSDSWEGAVDLLLSEEGQAEMDVLLSLAAPWVLGKLPPALTQMAPGEGEVAVDMRMTLAYAHDSLAQYEETLLTAGRRGLGALVVAGRGELGSGLQAQRVAERLRREGKLPAGFRVIVGEYVQSRGGAVLGLFLQDRVAEGMTIGETVRDIGRQGGLAYMARPGDLGAAPPLRRLPFAGYLMQAGNFELFRTLQLLDDPRLQGKPALYGSNLPFTFGPGLPYSNVPADRGGPDPLRAGLADRQGYAAGGLYLPWMMFLVTKPVALYQRNLNRYFEISDYLSLRAMRLLGADNVILRTSWDEGIRDLMSLVDAPGAVDDILDGSSPLRSSPRLTYLEVEYGPIALAYDDAAETWQVGARWRW